MSADETWTAAAAAAAAREYSGDDLPRSSFDESTGIYHSVHQLGKHHRIPTTPNLDTATFVLSRFPPHHQAESRVALIDSATNQRVTYAELHRSVLSLASGLYHALGIRKGDVIFVLSPNSLLYPTICLAVLSIGAVLTTANPLNTESEIVKQVSDSGATLAIAAPECLHKLLSTGVPTIQTSRPSEGDELSIEELISSCDPVELTQSDTTGLIRPSQSDTAAILYSSGTTGTSKGVVLTHSNLISIMALLRWTVDVTKAKKDVFLCFIPMFHIYGLAFFALGLFCCGTTTVLMERYELKSMLEAIQTHKVRNIPAVPPVILGLVKHAGRFSAGGVGDLSSLRRVSSGAAPLGKELIGAFRERFPWVELRPGYGLTESSGAATLFVSAKEAKRRPGSCGGLIPGFFGRIVDVDSGNNLGPYKVGELWLKSPTVMKEYLGKREATVETVSGDGWLRTGDLCYFDEDGFLYVVDRIKELIKHNGYQVAPAELEAILLAHPNVLDTAVVPVEDEEAGQIPMAYVVRAGGADELTEAQVIQYVALQVAPYKKIRKVGFINAIPRSAAGKILRKELVLQANNKHQIINSKL
ncbi:probable CoA ligase CCL5 [Humulus lupulus]|uniref:probable CoA ligase CCL5 n=1 Tax=Humulus lupulus TaxID=3486 RepID=UPI002B40159E|nr:probable CoA ligase CCL5 [Humulus lupulus]